MDETVDRFAADLDAENDLEFGADAEQVSGPSRFLSGALAERVQVGAGGLSPRPIQ